MDEYYKWLRTFKGYSDEKIALLKKYPFLSIGLKIDYLHGHYFYKSKKKTISYDLMLLNSKDINEDLNDKIRSLKW